MADLGVGFVDILPRTDKFVSTLSGQMNKGLSTVGTQASSSSKLVSGLQTAFIGLGAAAVAGIAKAVQSTVDWARQVASLQKVTGQSAESASSLLAVMGEFGIDATQAATAVGIFDKNIVHNTDSFTKYGIATEDAQGNLLPFDELLGAAADKFVTLDSAAEKTTFAMDVFGKSGKTLIPILKQGSAGLEELKTAAAATGLVIGQDTVDAAIALGHQQRILGESFKGLAVTIGTEFLPVATDLIHWATVLVQVLVKIPGPVFEVVAGFLALTAAVAGVAKVGGAVSDTWSKVIDVFDSAGEATADLTDTASGLADGMVVAEGATKGLSASTAALGTTGAIAGSVLGTFALAAAAVVIPVAVLIGRFRGLRMEQAAYTAEVEKDVQLLGVQGDAVRTLASLTDEQLRAQAKANVTQRLAAEGIDTTTISYGLINQEVDRLTTAQHAATEAVTEFDHAQELLGQNAKGTASSIAGVFREVEAGTTALGEVTDATTLLNKNLSDASGKLETFAERAGAGVDAILGGISKVVNDEKSTVDDVVAAYQNGITQLRQANQAWHDSIVATFGGAGTALDKFADKSNVDIGKAIGSLQAYTGKIKAFGSDIATIQKNFGKDAADFIQWASEQGLAQSGLVSKVAESNGKMGQSFIDNFNKANAATNSLASQIQKALDPVFQKILQWLQNVVRAIQGLPPLTITADAGPALSEINRVHNALIGLYHEEVAAGLTPSQAGVSSFKPVVGQTGGFVTVGGIRRFAAGGSTDTIPAMLSPGEFVIRKSAVDSIGVPALRKMNEGGAVGPVSKQKLAGSMRIYDWRNGLASLDAELTWEDAVRTR